MGVKITNSQEALPRARWHFRESWRKRSSVHSACIYILKPHSGRGKFWVRGHDGELAAAGISQVSKPLLGSSPLLGAGWGKAASVSERSSG